MSEENVSSEAGKSVPFTCDECGKTFPAKRNLLKHCSDFHGREKNGFQCVLCGNKLTKSGVHLQHLQIEHNQRIETVELSFESKSGKGTLLHVYQ